jgi:hypothetical protein
MSFQGRANQGKPSTSASLRLQSDLRSMRVEPPEVSFTISLFRVGRSRQAHQCASLFSVKRVRFRSRALFCFKEREGCRSAFSFVGVASVDDGDDDVRVVVLARWFHRIFFFIIIFLFFFSFLFLLLFDSIKNETVCRVYRHHRTRRTICSSGRRRYADRRIARGRAVYSAYD